ncbi:MAG: hypothetical protein JO002_05550 [Burkholderiaceae bacterium]|nr:hypothetical protein [Burkholderiaceae bacterium]
MLQNAAMMQTAQIKGQMPPSSGEVHDQLDKLTFALDAQQDIIQSLLRRIEPVAGNLELPCSANTAQTVSCLVPVAARIQSQVERIQSGNADLDRILSNLQI